ncbi:hypothetical protein HY449_00415 [Candidatus Pacearchaeota archaeon]|nr:hypothetical protein [Candidatus Pacearchaeota archaeon]
MANLIKNIFSAETIRISVATRINNGGYEHRFLEASGNIWNFYEPAVERLKKLNIESIEGIYCCYTEPKKAASECVLRKFRVFGKTFRHENIHTINN